MKAVSPKVDRVTLRQLPATLVFGLVAALAAHAGLFGGEHAMGGSFSGALLEGALSALAGLGAFAGLILFGGARFAADGSVLAARLSSALPGPAGLVLSATGWFALGEHLEPAHASVSAAAIALLLLAASWIVALLASKALRLLAAVVFSVARIPCHPEPVEGRLRITTALRQAQRDTIWSRRFTRPPPVIANA